MSLLKTLSPAEILVLLERKNVGEKDLLKFTFLDLLLKGVIRIREEEKTSGRKKIRTRKVQYIIAGPQYDVFFPLAHEHLLLAPFQKKKNIKVLFVHFIRIGFDNLKADKNFVRKNILKYNTLSPYFKKGIILNFVFPFHLNLEGKMAEKELRLQKDLLEKELLDAIDNDQSKAVTLLDKLKGNVFLLEGIELSLFKKIDFELERSLSVRNTGKLLDSQADRIDHLMVAFDSMLDAFDTFDSIGDSFDSGCSSDGCGGGCSGCSGCGGCS